MTFKNQPQNIAEKQYSMHDQGEEWTQQFLERHNIEYQMAGFDGRKDTDGENLVGGKPEEYNDEPDIYLPDYDCYVEVKTTSYEEYLGNVEESCWNHYNQIDENVWVFCFVLDDDKLVKNTGCYLVDETAEMGSNENPFGETYIEPASVLPVDYMSNKLLDKKVKN